MAMLRLNVPSVFLYGGSILPGKYKNKEVTVQDVFEAVGKYDSKKISENELCELEKSCMSISRFMWRSIYSKYYGVCC